MINGKLGKKLDEAFKYSHKCRCGHSLTIYPFEEKNKKICGWCGKYVYINETEEFKDKLRNLLGGTKNE